MKNKNEIEGGSCPECGATAQLRTCDDCGETAWIIDCGHMSQPRPIAGGRSDGSEGHRTFCEECAEIKTEVAPAPTTVRQHPLIESGLMSPIWPEENTPPVKRDPGQ